MPLLTSGSELIRHRSTANGLLNNLVAYWALDETGGANNALDKHSNALTLTQTASPGSAAGKVYAGARTFDGNTQFFSRANNTLLQIGDNDATLAAWVYIGTKGSFNHILSKQNGSFVEYILRYESDYFALYVRNATNTAYVNVKATTFGSPSTSTWIFVLAGYNATTDKVFIQINNGTEDTADLVSGLNTSTAEFNVGSQLPAATLPWNGRLGPIAMWKSTAGNGGVLSTAQRTALYNAGAGLAYASFTA